MHEARRFTKTRKPEKHIWLLPCRPVLVRCKDVTPKQFAALHDSRKFPPKLLKAWEEPFRCGTPLLHAAAFVGPRRPTIEETHKGYPQTNWKRKRLRASFLHRYFMRRVLRDPRYQ